MAKLIVGVNDLATVRPDLIKEWNFNRNIDIKSEDVTCGSGKKFGGYVLKGTVIYLV